MRIIKLFQLAIISFCILFFVACGEKGGQEPPTMVTFMTVATTPVALETELSGRISAFYVSEVRPQVSGIIQERYFIEGADVTEGNTLYQIDPAMYKAAFASANATLTQAIAQEKASGLLAGRYAKLVQVKAVSKQEYDNAVAEHETTKATVLAARAAVDTARINLEYTEVKAPVTGRIGRSSVTKGALVTQNQATPLAVIQQTDKMYVDVVQPSFAAMQMRKNMPENKRSAVRLLFQNNAEYALHGTLEFYDITVDPTTDMVNVRIIFPNDGNLLPGMFVRTVLTEQEIPEAILIPQKIATRDAKGGYSVRVLVKPTEEEMATGIKTYGELAQKMLKVEVRPVTVDRVVGVNQLYITGGLQAGELILYAGLQKVRPGALVLASPAPEIVQQSPEDDKQPSAVKSQQPSETSQHSSKSSDEQVDG